MDYVPAPTANEQAAAATIAPFQTPQRPLSAYEAPGRMTDIAEAANASYQLENWIASMRNAGTIQDNETSPVGWNPYTHIRENWDEQTQKRLEPYIRRGDFEIAATPADADRMRDAITAEQTLRDTAAKSGLGTVAGQLAAMATDPLSYAGVGWALRGEGIATSAFRWALQAGVTTGASEAILQDTQAMRDLHESALNIGGATLFGGGVGALIGRFRSAAPTIANGLGRVTSAMDAAAARGDGVIDRMLSDAAGESVGAAAVPPGTVVDLSAEAPVKLGGLNWFDKTAAQLSPMYRALANTSDAARNMLLRLTETSGTILGDREGNLVATPMTAEAVRNRYMAEWLNQWREGTEHDMVSLSRRLSDAGASRLDRNDFINELVMRNLDGRDMTDAAARAATRYGSAADDVLQTAKSIADHMHEINATKVEPVLIERGVLRDNARLDTAETKLAAMREQRDAEMAKLQESLAIAKSTAERAKRTGAEARATQNQSMASEAAGAVTELQGQIAERRAHWQTQIEPWNQVRNEQMSRPEPLGKDFGYAQLYDKTHTLLNADTLKSMLLEKFAGKPYEGWLREVHGLNNEKLAALATDDPARYRAIHDEWGADKYYTDVSIANTRLDAAQERLRQSEADLRQVSHYQGTAEDNLGRSADAAAKTEAQRVSIERGLKQAQSEADRQTLRAFKDAADGARRRTMDRATMDVAARPDVGEKELLDAIAKGRKAAEVRSKALQDPITAALERSAPGTVDNAGDVAKAARPADAAAQRATENPLTAPTTKEPPVSAAVARLEGKVREIEARIAAADRDVADHTQRLQEIGLTAAKHDDALVARKAAKKTLDDALKLANQTHATSARNVNELQRALHGATKAPVLDKTVDDLVAMLSQDGHLPRGSVANDLKLTETGRMKERTIQWTADEREKLMQMGVLRGDLMGILDSQYRSLAGHLGIREALGIGDTTGYKSFEDAVGVVRADYAQRISAAATDKAKVALAKEQDQAMKDIALQKDRLTGGDLSGIRDKDSLWYWGSNKMRQMALASFAPGFGLSSLTDLTGLMMNHKFGGVSQVAMNGMSKTLSQSSKQMLGAIYHATEMGLHDLSRMHVMKFEEAADTIGVGVKGTTKRSVTAGIDHVANATVRAASAVSFLPQLTRFIRTAAAMDTLNNMKDSLARFSELSLKDRAHWAMLGIDEPRANRISKYLEEHGTRSEGGNFDPNIDLWPNTRDSRVAQNDLNMALQRDMTTASPAQHVGDTPHFMSTQMGKMLTQFQTFNFVVYNRVIAPAIQRMWHLGDWRMAGVLSTTFPLAATNWAVKDTLSGKDPMERWTKDKLPETMYGLVDRAGFLNWLSPYADGVGKFAGVLGTGSRYSQNNWWQSLLGVQFSQVTNMADVANQLRDKVNGTGRDGALGTSVARVSPFAMYARFANTLMKD